MNNDTPKKLYQLEKEVEELEIKDKKNRNFHGSNQIIDRIKKLTNDLKNELLGECEYCIDNECLILNDYCDVINRSHCLVRKNRVREVIKNKSKIIESEQNNTKKIIKKNNKVFEDIEGYKKNE